MNLFELQNYDFWLVRSPAKVLAAVAAIGGWKVVFPTKLPVWASKVRNYFNVPPIMLKRLSANTARSLLNRSDSLPFLVECHEVRSANEKFRDYKLKPWGYDPDPFKVPNGCPVKASHNIRHMSLKESLAQKNSLSGDVYLDNQNNAWYQMSAGSTIYHWGDEPTSPALEAAYQNEIMGQNDTPVFKLVCPDGTGGSREVIIFNPVINWDSQYGNRSTHLGVEENKYAEVRSITQTDTAYQGSYNYSETTRIGLAAHELRDVKPHVPGRFFYVNPTDPYAPLDQRKFPELDLQQKPLTDQE